MPNHSKLRVFLGGTVNGSAWRSKIIPLLKVDYFNPVVDVWDEKAWKREIHEREVCDYNLYILTPKMLGYYSIAEVVDDSFKKPGHTLYCHLITDDDSKFTAQQLESLRYLGGIVEENGGIWCKSLDEVVLFFNKLENQSEYFKAYQKLLNKAVEWNRADRSPAKLLSGFPLIHAQQLIHESASQHTFPATRLMQDFYQASSSEEFNFSRISAFISYARKPSSDLAKNLCEQLEARGINIWFDKLSIRVGIDFREEIRTGIEKAGNFIYIITEESVRSPFCAMELELAMKSGKRIIPIQQGQVDENHINKNIQAIHRLFYHADEFDKLIEDLEVSLNNDHEYIQRHTSLLQKAITWQNENKSKSFLLKKNNVVDAHHWLQFSQNALPPATPSLLHCEFICESKKYFDNNMVDCWVCSDNQGPLESQLINELRKYGLTSNTTWENENDANIIQSAKFIFIVNSHTVNNEKCLQQFKTARQQCIPIFPLIETDLGSDELLTFEEQKNTYDISALESQPEAILAALGRFIQDSIYRKLKEYREAAFLRQQYNNWALSQENAAYLLRDYSLEFYADWLQKNKTFVGSNYDRFFYFLSICEQQQIGIISDVFLAYHSSSQHFASLVKEKLNQYQKIVWADQPFMTERSPSQALLDNIERSENFIAILSDEIFHKRTLFQIQKAKEVGKRIVFISEGEDIPIPPEYAEIDIFDFTEDFDLSLTKLVRYLDTDFQYIKKHNQILRESLAWDKSGKKGEKLLQEAAEIEAAVTWRAQANGKQIGITALQNEFIEESIKAQKKRKRASTLIIYAMTLLALLSIGFGVQAIRKSKEAIKNHEQLEIKAEIARQNLILAEQNEKKAKQRQQEAEESQKTAIKAQKEAEAQRKQAEENARKALKASQEAQDQKEIAEYNWLLAENSEQIAKNNKQLALDEKSKADRLATIEKIKNKALLSESLLLTDPLAARDSILSAYDQLAEYPEDRKSSIFFQALSKVDATFSDNHKLLNGKRALIQFKIEEDKLYALSENGILRIINTNQPESIKEIQHQAISNTTGFEIIKNTMVIANRYGEIKTFEIDDLNEELIATDVIKAHRPNVTITDFKKIKIQDQNYFISTGYDGTLSIYTLVNKKIKQIIKSKNVSNSTILALDVAQDGSLIGITNNQKELIILNTQHILTESQTAFLIPPKTLKIKESATAIRFLDSQQVVIGFESGKVEKFHLFFETYTALENQQKHKMPVTALLIDHNLIVSGSRDSQVILRFWEDDQITGEAQQIFAYPGHHSPNEIQQITFLPQSQEIVSMDNQNVLRWKTDINSIYQSLKNQP